MLFICAPDSFKESMSATVAARAMERGIRQVFPDATVVLKPMADGGEGTCETIAAAMGIQTEIVDCHDALGRPGNRRIAYVPDQALAIIDAAEACGLEKLAVDERDPLCATSRGVGDLILAGLDRGAGSLLVGLGGSATNDAGVGMMSALGARFLDADGCDIPPGGAALAKLASIDLEGFDHRLRDVTVRVASDVTNPLTGPRGASVIFGPQKGANTEDVAVLDAALERWADVVDEMGGRKVRDVPGAGAAGGMGATFLAFFNAELESGADLVMDVIGLDEHLGEATVVFTGEGSFDQQSAAGKVPLSVAARARAHGVPTVVFAGKVDPAAADQPPAGVTTLVPIVRDVGTLHQAMENGESNLERAVAMTCRMMKMDTGIGHDAPAPQGQSNSAEAVGLVDQPDGVDGLDA